MKKLSVIEIAERRERTSFICTKCGVLRLRNEFFADKLRPSGVKPSCKSCQVEQVRKWRMANPGVHAAQSRKDNARLRDQLIEAYGGKCVCCGESRREFMTLDHIYGGGTKERKKTHGGWVWYQQLRKQGWPKDKYRLLCWNCNCGRKFTGVCPHESEAKNEINSVAVCAVVNPIFVESSMAG